MHLHRRKVPSSFAPHKTQAGARCFWVVIPVSDLARGSRFRREAPRFDKGEPRRQHKRVLFLSIDYAAIAVADTMAGREFYRRMLLLRRPLSSDCAIRMAISFGWLILTRAGGHSRRDGVGASRLDRLHASKSSPTGIFSQRVQSPTYMASIRRPVRLCEGSLPWMGCL
jgi:hypothetical protein